MAEATSLRNNALPYPVYAVAWTVVFPLLDADGDPVSPSSPDSEVSKNADTFADCTNEATEIATSSGVCYLTLTASEMTADIVAVRIQSTGAKTTILTLYPRKLPVLATGTCQGSNDTGDIQLASGDSAVDDTYNGCLCVAVIDGTTEARIINDYAGSTKVGEVSPAWNTAQPDSNDTYTIYLPEGRQVGTVNATHWNSLATVALPLVPATAGRSLVVDAAGLADANMVKVGPTGSGTAQTARDIGASVLLSSGTGTGQVKLSSGYVAPNWGDVGNPTTTVNLSGTTTNVVNTATAVTTVNGLAANVITAAAAAADFGAEIQALITGGAYALSTDANGRVRIVDGTGTGEIDTTSGGVLVASLAANSLTAAAAAADLGTEIGTAVWASATRTLTSLSGVTADANVVSWLGTAVATPTVAGVPAVDVTHSVGVLVRDSEYTIASATSSTATLPTADRAGNAIPDDGARAWTARQVVGGTGVGQVVVFTTSVGSRVYNVLSGTMPVTLDNTSKCVELGSIFGNISHAVGTAWASGAITASALASGAITASAIAADAITSSGLAASAVSEIQAAITGGAYALQADASGYLKLSDGTGTGQIDITSGGVLVSQLATQAKADVNAEVVDCLATDTYAEPGRGSPAATTSIAAKVGYLYKAWRNLKHQTFNQFTLYNDAGDSVDQQADVSSDGVTSIFSEMVTGV